jgi:hypothetical protein
MESLKDQIIYNVFEYLETKDLSFSLKAQENLQLLAKYYHITIKKQAKKDLKVCFKAFILNGKGYIETLTSLYNAL